MAHSERLLVNVPNLLCALSLSLSHTHTHTCIHTHTHTHTHTAVLNAPKELLDHQEAFEKFYLSKHQVSFSPVA